MTAWRKLFISDEEERIWRAHGIHQPEVVLLYIEWGLTPSVLDIVVDGQTVTRWLQSGEGPGQVVARLRARGLFATES